MATTIEQTKMAQKSDLLAQGLGWFSIGLGAAELFAPGMMARLIGMDDISDNRKLLRVFGLREIVAGVGILTAPRTPSGWLWARVAGDAMDTTVLVAAAASETANQQRLAIAASAVGGGRGSGCPRGGANLNLKKSSPPMPTFSESIFVIWEARRFPRNNHE